LIRPAAFSLGSNLGDRRRYLDRAARGLARELEEARFSSVWETEPVEVEGEQPAYLNLCVAGWTDRGPQELLELCARLEAEAGRRGLHREPRVLDVDLLLLGDEIIAEDDLVLPHSGLARRRFVLAPLAELLPDWRHPATDRSVASMLAELGESQKIRLHKPVKG